MNKTKSCGKSNIGRSSGFSTDEQYLAIHKHETCKVEVWDVQQRKRVKRLKNLMFVEAANFSFDPTNTLLAMTIDYNTLGIFEISTNGSFVPKIYSAV